MKVKSLPPKPLIWMGGSKKDLRVLHVFQKKSKSGIETPKTNMDLIEARLKEAAETLKVSQS